MNLFAIRGCVNYFKGLSSKLILFLSILIIFYILAELFVGGNILKQFLKTRKMRFRYFLIINLEQIGIMFSNKDEIVFK